MQIITKFNVGDRVRGKRGDGRPFNFTVGEIQVQTLPNHPGYLLIRYRSVHRPRNPLHKSYYSNGSWVAEMDCEHIIPTQDLNKSQIPESSLTDTID